MDILARMALSTVTQVYPKKAISNSFPLKRFQTPPLGSLLESFKHTDV